MRYRLRLARNTLAELPHANTFFSKGHAFLHTWNNCKSVTSCYSKCTTNNL